MSLQTCIDLTGRPILAAEGFWREGCQFEYVVWIHASQCTFESNMSSEQDTTSGSPMNVTTGSGADINEAMNKLISDIQGLRDSLIHGEKPQAVSWSASPPVGVGRRSSHRGRATIQLRDNMVQTTALLRNLKHTRNEARAFYGLVVRIFSQPQHNFPPRHVVLVLPPHSDKLEPCLLGRNSHGNAVKHKCDVSWWSLYSGRDSLTQREVRSACVVQRRSTTGPPVITAM
jgi:hypothetical protein